ncbi:hypothetical protein FA103_09940 [Pseudomonas aeruginosa]|nr:hypothetical protein [Pseudomonas aeruginosa]
MPRPCQRRSRHHRSLLIGLALLSPVHAADYLAGLPPPQPAPSGGSNVLYYLELVINGRDSGQVVPVNAADGHYLLDAAALREAGVRLPGNPAGQVAVDALPEVRADYDSASQQLHLQVPPDWLPEQRFDDPGLVARAPARSSLGALFNYDLYYSDPADGATPWLSALLEQRLFDGFGVISNTGVYTRYFGDADNLDSRYLRYDTYWLYNDERNMHSYQLGDYVNGALNWTTPVRMGGFRFARNFGVRPDLVTYPLLRFDGQAAVPSTVDLFINGYKASSADLQPGPFAISNVPYINGAGEATVVTTDAQGRQVVTSLPFYVSNTLLARGLSDFDLSVGRLRDDYGLRNFSYADNAASGIYRYGVSDRLTLSTHAEAASDLRLLGIGGDIAVATFGTLSLAASGSDGQGDSGQQYLLGYSYYSRRLGLSLQHIERSAGYGDLGTLDGEYQLSRRTDQATASLTFDEQGTIGTGYFDIRARDGSRTRLANLSYSRPIGSRSSFYLALNKDLDGDGYSALMQLVIPFDINGLLNIGVTRDSDRRYSERVIWSRSTPSQGGLGWNLGYGGGASRYQQADLTWRMQNVQLQGGLYGETGNYTRWADLSGSLVWMDNAVFASNRINDAFVLVSTKGYPQVPIRYENQLMGSTDDNGHLLVPWVAAYYPAKFQIEPLDLPANVSAPEVEQRVAVRQGSGLLLDFPIRAVVAASIGDLGTLDGEYQLSRRTDQATASLTFDEQGTIGTGYFDIRARDGSRTRLANLSYSRPIGSRSSFYLALNKDLDGDGYSALMQLVIPFDINGLLNIGVTRDSDRRYSERVIWSRSTPSQGGLGWNLGYGGGASRYQQADLTWRMQNVQLQGGLYGETGNYTRWADLSGSLVWMDNAVFASNRINDAFVLVSTKGYPQVPIRYENQLMGSTDDNGHLLVPWVAAYYPAKFQIEPLDLPANVSAPEVEQRVAVRQGSGLLLDFPIRAVVAASISLVDERGEPLPLGSQAEETGSGQRASVGWDGQVYFEGLQSDNQLRVVRPDGRACQARFRLDTRKPTVSQVGPLTCSAPIGDTP